MIGYEFTISLELDPQKHYDRTLHNYFCTDKLLYKKGSM